MKKKTLGRKFRVIICLIFCLVMWLVKVGIKDPPLFCVFPHFLNDKINHKSQIVKHVLAPQNDWDSTPLAENSNISSFMVREGDQKKT